MNNKEFDKWNELKKNLHDSKEPIKFYFSEREIWWCSLGLNVGIEAFGKGEAYLRPVLVIKKLSIHACIVLPLTSKEKEREEWFVEILFKCEPQWVMVHQIRFLDTKRFRLKIGKLNITDFVRVKEKLEILHELSRDMPSQNVRDKRNLPPRQTNQRVLPPTNIV